MLDTEAAKAGKGDQAPRLRTLDFLRGLAILGVISIHATQHFPSHVKALDFVLANGWVGVQVFFLVSAYTMCHMWRLRAGETHPALKFYVRRFLRIAPLFWVAIAVYLIVEGMGASFFAPFGIGPLQIGLAATFLHGFRPDTINAVVPGGWSIAIEMSFYAIFPLLIVAFGARRFAYLGLAIVTFLLNALILKPVLTHAFLTGAFVGQANLVEFFLHDYFPVEAPIFLVGCFLYFSLDRPLGWQTFAALAAWVGVGALSDHFVPVHEFHYVLIYLALAAFVFAALKFGVQASWVELFGRNSYAIYLSHFLVLEGLALAMPWQEGPAALLLGTAATALLSLAIARLTYRFIEGPAQRLASRLTRGAPSQPRKRVFEVAGAASVNP